MALSTRAFNSVSTILSRITYHPFVTGLAKGTLPKSNFQFYLRDDLIYLREYATQLKIIADRFPNAKAAQLLMKLSSSSLSAEKFIREAYLEDSFSSMKMSLACQTYIDYIAKKASEGSLEEAVASVVACPWVYKELGKSMNTRTNQNEGYKRLIESFSCPNYIATTNALIEIFDTLAVNASPSTQIQMLSTFTYATRCEYDFFNSAWNLGVVPLMQTHFIFKNPTCKKVLYPMHQTMSSTSHLPFTL